jgi:hypothetical protein
MIRKKGRRGKVEGGRRKKKRPTRISVPTLPKTSGSAKASR